MTPEQRLDRLDAIVTANAQAIANNTQAIGEMRETMQQGFMETREQITQLRVSQEQGFAESRSQIEQSSSYLVGVVGDFVEEMQQDRETMRQVIDVIRQMQTDVREMQTEVRGLQVENQRILRHLFGEEQ